MVDPVSVMATKIGIGVGVNSVRESGRSNTVDVGATQNYGLSTDSDSQQSPRSTTSSRSSKRAHSSTSVNERNKFRNKLDGFLTYTTSSTELSQDHSSVALENESNPTSSSSDETHNPRHYSASSVTGDPLVTKDIVSPLDYFYNNKSLDPLFPVKLIDQNQLKSIMNHHYSTPLPECDSVFPWLHGIHHSNQTQKLFLVTLTNMTTVNRNNFDTFKSQTEIPNSYRGLMPVRSGCVQIPERILESSPVLKGSVSPDEILCSVDVSKEALLILLDELLKDIKVDENTTQEGDFQTILKILFDDCSQMGVLPIFKNLDPQKGISLRNFQIQVSKMAQVSDFIVYCFNETHEISKDGSSTRCQCGAISRILYFAQLKHSIDHPELVDSLYSTLLLEKNDIEFYSKNESNKNLLALDRMIESDTVRAEGNFCSKFDLECFENWDMNYLLREKFEISKMSSATRINGDVWAGNSIDFEVSKLKGFDPSSQTLDDSAIPLYVNPENSTCTVTKQDLLEKGENLLINPAKANWKLFVYCCDGSTFPELTTLRYLINSPSLEGEDICLNFPPSGSIGIGDCTDTDLISIINTCKLLYTKSSTSESSLIHCSDGYTESSLLIVCYMIYSTGKSLEDVVLDLHKVHGRPLFLFPPDVQLLTRIENILIHYSPSRLGDSFVPNEIEVLENSIIYKHLFMPKEETWFSNLNGSLPSRILPHLYLGSLSHANSFELLKELGITKIVSVGENLSWITDDDYSKLNKVRILNGSINILSGFTDCDNPIKEVMNVTNIQDDGIDMLTHTLEDILKFINEGYESNEKVLVHCRVGVSRSATVCIAEVMRRLKINLIRAYIYVRVRRLNIIIQPNLRFMYELFKWEESERLSKLTRKIRTEKLADSPTAYNKTLSAQDLKRLSGSISSLVSDVSVDVNIDDLIDPVSTSPLRLLSRGTDALDGDDEDEYDENDDGSEEDSYWLRDVDWHILCREIDLLNKAYIRV